MKMKSLIVYAVAMLFAVSLSIYAAPSKRKGKPTARPQTATTPSNEELQQLLRHTQEAVEQAQADARQARQQSEELKKRLDENTRELAMLRQAIEGQIAELRSEKDQSKPEVETVQSALPKQPGGQSAINNLPPSIEDRLDHLQEQVEVNTAQIKEQAQTKVETDSRFRVKLFGMILANTYMNTDSSSLIDLPMAAPQPTTNVGKNNFGATLRQSRIGLAMEGPRLGSRLGEARLSAEAEFDFWGGTSGQVEGDVLGFLRIITASARLDWEKTSLIIGQRPPLISPLNPTSIAAVWIPPMTAAGNISQWRPQITIEHRAGSNDLSQMVIQGGLMMPFGESLQGRAIEGGPGYQSRIAYRRALDSDRKLELGFGGYFHRRPFTFDRQVSSYAVTGDWTIPLGGRIELSGEAFFGRAVGLAEESGSRNDRLYAVTGPIDLPGTTIRGIHTAGGWLQLAIKARSDLDFNFAYGQEDPRNRDLLSGQISNSTRFKNQVGSANFIWQLRQNLLLSLEYRRFWTNYTLRQRTGNHYNLAVGYLF